MSKTNIVWERHTLKGKKELSWDISSVIDSVEVMVAAGFGWCSSNYLRSSESVNLHLFVTASSRKHSSHLLFCQWTEVLSASQDTNWDVVLSQLSLSCTRAHCLHSMCDQCVTIKGWESFVMLLKVCLSRLALVTDCHWKVLVVVAWWAGLEQMGASLVDGAHEETHSEGTLRWVACLRLSLLSNDWNETLARVLRPINVRIVQASVAHELSEEACISGHAWDANSHVGVDLEHFLLVHSQVMRALFQSNQDLSKKHDFLVNTRSNRFRYTYDVGVGLEAEAGWPLLNSFLSIVNLYWMRKLLV